MTDDDTTIPTSLALRIGLSVLDGASVEWLEKTYAVSAKDIEQAWLLCREYLSRHFADIEDRDYELMDEAALRDRLDDTLRLLIDWRSNALQKERLAELTSDQCADEMISSCPTKDLDETAEVKELE